MFRSGKINGLVLICRIRKVGSKVVETLKCKWWSQITDELLQTFFSCIKTVLSIKREMFVGFLGNRNGSKTYTLLTPTPLTKITGSRPPRILSDNMFLRSIELQNEKTVRHRRRWNVRTFEYRSIFIENQVNFGVRLNGLFE